MSTPFIDDDFLLSTSQARDLYHGYAERLPIIDYHCHLPPEAIADDRQFENLTQIWLQGDHYKWRAMRTRRRARALLHRAMPRTGRSSSKWAETVPKTLRNPLYHWTHLD